MSESKNIMKMVTTLGCKMGQKSKKKREKKVVMKKNKIKMQDETFFVLNFFSRFNLFEA